MRSSLTTTAATYAVLSLAGSVPLFMPESVALPGAWGENSPSAITLRGTMREVRGRGAGAETGSEIGAEIAVRPVTITLERRTETGLYVSRDGVRGADARRDRAGRDVAARDALFELTAFFTHEEGAGHVVRVSGADRARILIDGRLVAEAANGPESKCVELDALENLENGHSYEIGFVLTDSSARAPAFRIETSLRLETTRRRH